MFKLEQQSGGKMGELNLYKYAAATIKQPLSNCIEALCSVGLHWNDEHFLIFEALECTFQIQSLDIKGKVVFPFWLFPNHDNQVWKLPRAYVTCDLMKNRSFFPLSSAVHDDTGENCNREILTSNFHIFGETIVTHVLPNTVLFENLEL